MLQLVTLAAVQVAVVPPIVSATTSVFNLKTVAMITPIYAKTQHVKLFPCIGASCIMILLFAAPEYNLAVANGDNIFFVHYEGESFETLRFNASQTAQGIDIHFK